MELKSQLILVQLTMIKRIFSGSHFAKCFNYLSPHNKHPFATTSQILRESDAISQSEIDLILGNEPQQQLSKPQEALRELENRQLFYGLVPTKNEDFPICIDPDFVELMETPNQNIMNALNLTVDSSFQDYCNGIQTFWKEDQLYGSVSPPTQIQPHSLEFNHVLTHDSPYLQKMRKNFLVNLSMPGSIQAQDARNFLQLRPVEQFRHTPIIPIAQSTMRRHKQKLQEYHRRQLVFQISRESIYNFVMFCIAAGVCGYMVYLVLQKEEERTVAYTRLKYNRRMGIQEPPTFRI